jgi:hypothetical protein
MSVGRKITPLPGTSTVVVTSIEHFTIILCTLESYVPVQLNLVVGDNFNRDDNSKNGNT